MPHCALRCLRSMHRLRAVGAAAALAVALIGGCASNAPAVTGDEPTFTASYAEGRYEQAYRTAATAAAYPGGANAEAGLIAGLSAHALNRPDEARRWLEPLVGHADPSVSGRASAALGLIAQNRGEHQRAATLLADAAGRLGGNQGARAALYAGDSYAALGQADEARRQYERAGAMVTNDTALQSVVSGRLAGGKPPANGDAAAAPAASGPYSIQLGAFSSPDRANALARQAQTRADATGLGQVRIFQDRDRLGRVLNFVRVGYFPSRTAAADGRSRLGMGGIVAETAGEGR